MPEVPEYTLNFSAFRNYEAVYQAGEREQMILLEFRHSADEKELVFTVVGEYTFHANSIHELVYKLPSITALSIAHSIYLQWNGVVKKAELIEIFMPSQKPHNPQIAALKLRLIVDGKTYETTPCETLTDAILELDESIGTDEDWCLRTCYHCQSSGYARDYILSDREYWCYRDVPDAFEEIKAKGKYASQSARFAGKYFVDAFHSCAAWHPMQPVFSKQG